MSEDGAPEADENVRQVVASGIRELTSDITGALQQKTGKRLTEEELEQIIAPAVNEIVTEVSIQASHYYSGPMPSPQVMQGYVSLFPGAAKQLFQQFKDEQTHRHAWENQALSHANSERRRRDIGAYAVVAAGIVFAFYLATLGATSAAALLVGVLVLGGGALVLGRQFFASHAEGETTVQINSDEQANHSTAKTQKATGKQRSRQRQNRRN